MHLFLISIDAMKTKTLRVTFTITWSRHNKWWSYAGSYWAAIRRRPLEVCPFDYAEPDDTTTLINGGAMRDRTADLFRAREALSQLSYSPLTCLFCAALRCHRRSVSHMGLPCSFPLSSGASISTKNPALPYPKSNCSLAG